MLLPRPGRPVACGGQLGNVGAAARRGTRLRCGGRTSSRQGQGSSCSSQKPSPLGSKAVLQPWLCEVFDTAYVPDRAQRRHRFVSPAWGDNADGIAGIAPALVVAAEFDRLRAEAKRYADKLEAVGALAEYVEVRDVDHGYDIMTDETELIRGMYEVITAHVRRAIS
ncbi:alpha/beta hydrolase fold domain-containing protein [Pseudonocardia xinjiangensis]|uniref:alpha/beta hydrolase fold domain-containing protein n=1 Tax=Pseudonocardia xinjiangensis TaxID=75289 RepID=UPI003D91DFFA